MLNVLFLAKYILVKVIPIKIYSIVHTIGNTILGGVKDDIRIVSVLLFVNSPTINPPNKIKVIKNKYVFMFFIINIMY